MSDDDISQLRLYRGSTLIGSTSAVNIGSATTVSPTKQETIAAGSTQSYTITAVVSSTLAVGGHAFRTSFAGGGAVSSLPTAA